MSHSHNILALTEISILLSLFLLDAESLRGRATCFNPGFDPTDDVSMANELNEFSCICVESLFCSASDALFVGPLRSEVGIRGRLCERSSDISVFEIFVFFFDCMAADLMTPETTAASEPWFCDITAGGDDDSDVL